MAIRINVFRSEHATGSERRQQIHAFYELLHTVVDFLAAMLFLVGSVLFFSADTTFAATWLFVIGSLFFGLKPTIRLARELHFLRIGAYEKMFERVDG